MNECLGEITVFEKSGGPLTCLAAQAALNSKEREFLHSLLTWRGTPTPKRMAWLTRSCESLP